MDRVTSWLCHWDGAWRLPFFTQHRAMHPAMRMRAHLSTLARARVRPHIPTPRRMQVRACELAAEWRQTWGGDVVLDLIGYRRWVSLSDLCLA